MLGMYYLSPTERAEVARRYACAADNEVCPDCGSTTFVEDWREGDKTCNRCGLVVESHMISDAPEYRTFADDLKDPSRVGGKVGENGRLDSTMIGKGAQSSKLVRLQARVVKGDKPEPGDKDIREIYDDLCDVLRAAIKRDSAIAMFKFVKSKLPGYRAPKALMGACCFFVDGGIPLRTLAQLFAGGDSKPINAAMKVAREVLMDEPTFQRIINDEEDMQCAKILDTVVAWRFSQLPFAQLWDLKKFYRDLLTNVRDARNGTLGSCKPSCLAAAVVFAGWRMMLHAKKANVANTSKIVITEKDFQKFSSASTLKDHVQQIYGIMRARVNKCNNDNTSNNNDNRKENTVINNANNATRSISPPHKRARLEP
jgi:transcription initiation factor TFIIIB Brf1 subunit/transcription initiation factor TFIIB